MSAGQVTNEAIRVYIAWPKGVGVVVSCFVGAVIVVLLIMLGFAIFGNKRGSGM